MSVSTIASLVLANTTTNAGTITLPPANQIQGRVITFKDSGGNFVNKALTLACAGADTFEDGTTTKTLRETYGTVQVAASGSKWYVISGTQVNTLAASTIKTAALSTINISSATATLSSIGLINQQGSTLSMYQASTFLYFNNFIVAGARVGVGQMFYPAGTLVLTTFTYTGADQTFTVPAGITSLTLYMWSAAGGGVTSINGAFKGGAGAYVQGTLTVSGGQVYTVIVGGGGTVADASITTNAYKNGGAAINNSPGYLEGGGGGRSGLQLSGVNLIAVGAGGGAGGSGNGGAGGITAGSNGSGSSTNYGLGGTQSAGGAAGTGTYNTASPGTQYGGGNAPSSGVGGGGGDGYYGGGGGVAFGSGQQGGGGGGGSSLTSNLGSLVTAVSSNGYSAPNSSSSYYQAGVATGSALSGGNGLVVIAYYK